ncbi:hypothetical protein Cgig2_005679 [Carnegiea gigantea]|uniref:RING-type domain-containing protein n=1 Tax=Carnegiea gigantea TaxID=171969 RepID=A0A9Q1QHU3_9CARY|nr:hypothetical protein Cgig2_005679 [Carnegiea gigantea]
MGSDAIANARISAFARDSAKKKKGSRFGKVKQNKVDVRREQWISQVKNKGCRMESDALPSTIPRPIDGYKAQTNLPMRARGRDEHEPIALPWPSKKMGRSHCSSGNDFTERTGRRRTSSSSFRGGEGEQDYDEGCLNNWEAMVDALPSLNTSKRQTLESDSERLTRSSSDQRCCKSVNIEDTGMSRGHLGNARAWAPDDRFRPRSLPRVSTKQQKQKKKLQVQNPDSWGSPRLLWQEQIVLSEPGEDSACPICCEEFDVTDSSFLPCPCGFRLCLFCHKRILEVDARCPGCRKKYDSVHTGGGFDSRSVVAHSWSMSK